MSTNLTQETIQDMKVVPISDMETRIRSGDLIFGSGVYPFSRLIRRVTGSQWSHVGTIFKIDELGGIFVIESVETIGVRMIPLSRYLEDYRESRPYFGDCVVARVDLPQDFSATAALNFGASHLGATYDQWENLRIAWRLFSKQGRLTSDDRYNCAEMAAAILEHGGCKLASSTWTVNTPEWIWQNLVSRVLGRIH